jgi:hypothetical protein
LAGSTEVLDMLATIGCGIHGAVNLRFDSFAQFYFIIGSFSSAVYLLLTLTFTIRLIGFQNIETDRLVTLVRMTQRETLESS